MFRTGAGSWSAKSNFSARFTSMRMHSCVFKVTNVNKKFFRILTIRIAADPWFSGLESSLALYTPQPWRSLPLNRSERRYSFYFWRHESETEVNHFISLCKVSNFNVLMSNITRRFRNFGICKFGRVERGLNVGELILDRQAGTQEGTCHP